MSSRRSRASIPTILSLALLVTLLTEPALRGQVNPGAALRIGEVDPVAAWLPPGTVAHVMISGAACMQGYGDLSITRIVEDPAVQAFLKPVRQMVIPFVRVWVDQVCEGSGVTPEELEALASSRLTVSFIGIERAESPEGDSSFTPAMLGTLHFGSRLETMEKLLDYVEITLEESDVGMIERHSLEGVSVRSLQIRSSGGPESFWYALAEDTLLVATTRDTLADVLRRRAGKGEGLDRHTPFEKVTRQVLRPRSALFAYLDTVALSNLLSATIDENLRAMSEAVGLDAFESLGYGCDLDGRGLRDRLYFHSSNKKGLLASFKAPVEDIRSHHLVPADCGFYFAGATDLVGTWDVLSSLYERSLPFEVARIKQAVGRFERRFGFSLRDDLLAGLGPEYAVIASFPRRAVIPDCSLMIQVRDRAKIEGILEDLVSGFAAEYETGRFQWLGQTVGWATVGVEGLRPSWTFVDDFLLIAPWPQSIKRFLSDRKKKTPRLAEDADFKALLAHLRQDNPKTGRAGLSYLDFTALVGFLADNGTPVLQTLLTPSPSFPVDFARLPETERVTRHLFGVIGASHWEGNGSYHEYYSPTGLLLPYFTLLGTAGVFLAMTPTELPGLEMGSGDIEFVDDEPAGAVDSAKPVEAAPKGPPKPRPTTRPVIEDG